MNVSFNPNTSYNKFTAVSHPAKVSFGTNRRSYVAPNGDTIGTQSWLFRRDLEWKRLAAYEKTHFRDKKRVNIVQFACSDGSEAYSKIISLLENNTREDDEKFFPIRAYDIDEKIIGAAKSGLLNTITSDRMELQINAGEYEDYFAETNKKLEIKNSPKENNQITLKAKNKLKDKVRFEKADMYNVLAELNDNSDTILMCRNILGYFEEDEVESFVKKVSNKLKTGSLFIIGAHDRIHTEIDVYLIENNFCRVMDNVYKKTE